MLDRLLHFFPPQSYPLTLVSDPDGLLNDEGILAALAERGFTLVDEPDPVHLRYRVQQARPFSSNHPLIVVTAGPLNKLPYDLWQQGHHVTLALHTFFPHLAYPVVRALTPPQRWRLSKAPSPPRRLGRRTSMDYILRHAFDADLGALRQPAGLIAWLNDYHQQADPMPPVLADRLLAQLRPLPAFADWSLDELLADRDAFARFVGEQWVAYVQQQTGQLLGETPIRYVLSFEADGDLQDTVPSLVRSGTLSPLQVNEPHRLPPWARPALLAPDEDRLPRRMAELLIILAEQMDTALAEARWERWQAVARAWAELNTLRYHPDGRLDEAQRMACERLQEKLDAEFLDWLRQRYAPLGSQRLPTPHHLHHVPHYIAYQRRQGRADRVVLLILDGMSLADWTLIGPAWRARHPDWRFGEHLLLAQVPTITAISRQALVSGLRPADFAATLNTNKAEPGQWSGFWAREDMPAEACAYAHLNLDRAGPPPVLDSALVQALCLVDSSIDDMLHGASLGAADVQASLRLWLEQQAPHLEMVIAGLLDHGFTIYLASDHGHVEARGIGQPSEGLTVDTRSKRARLYSDWHAATNVQQGFSQTVLWSKDGLLPNNAWVLMPQGRNAFDTFNETVVTHGGLTLDEVVVPLVTIDLRE